MCDSCQELEKELKGKAVLDKDFYHSLLFDAGVITKAATPGAPNFKVDKNIGEGIATKEEVKYRQDLKNLIKKVWDGKDDLNDSEVKELIDKLFIDEHSEGKELAESFITFTYTKNAETMIRKLKKLKINKKMPKKSDVLDALVDWQCFAVEKIGVMLYYGIIGERKGTVYYEAAYGNQKEA